MRILYGVVGEGMGHATRSRVTIEHLLSRGHHVEVVVSGRAHEMLSKHFKGVHRIHGLHMIYEDNEVKKTRTALSNLKGALLPASLREGLPGNVRQWYEMAQTFAPDAVISDFESWSYLFGKACGVPVISIDNMQILSRCHHDDEVFAVDPTSFLLAKGIVRGKLPHCYHYLITTFFYPPTKRERTTLIPPILRPEVLAAQPSREDHVLVYQSGEGAESIASVLKQFGHQRFLVYGMRRGIAEAQIDGNLEHQPFSETRFVDHLASAKAVVAGGGFSLMGEAVYLRKPMLSVPLEGQFEQTLNAVYLEKLGYGLFRREIQPGDIDELLKRAPEFQSHLDAYSQPGNQRLFDAVDELLERIEAGDKLLP